MKISGAGYEYLFSNVSDGNMSRTWGKKTDFLDSPWTSRG